MGLPETDNYSALLAASLPRETQDLFRNLSVCRLDVFLLAICRPSAVSHVEVSGSQGGEYEGGCLRQQTTLVSILALYSTDSVFISRLTWLKVLVP